MATRQLLGALAALHAKNGGAPIAVETVGGVDAARRVEQGEAFDLVVLAADAMTRLEAHGALVPGTARPVADSEMAIAVRRSASRPDVSTEPALRESLLRAHSIGYSTGPSGAALLALLERWHLRDALAEKLIQAPPGVPVGRLIADGAVQIGFQQLSELMHLPGIELLGGMPPGTAITTTFVGALSTHARRPLEARAALEFFCSAATHELKRQHGMSP